MNLRSAVLALAVGAIASLGATGALAQDTTAAQTPPQTETPPTAAPTDTTTPTEAATPPAEASPPASATPSDTTSATVGAPPEGKGKVVIFRPSEFVGGALTFTAREGETVIGHVGSGRYFAIDADPGVHEYNIRGGETVRVEVEPGETTYLRLHVSMGLLSGHGALAPSTREEFDAKPLRVWEEH